MQVKFPPLIDVEAQFAGAKGFGAETIALELNLGKKVATITMNRAEASALVAALKALDVTPPVNLGGIVLPGKK